MDNKDNKNLEFRLSDQEREYINDHLSERVKTDISHIVKQGH